MGSERNIRVFISSTFRDMEAERNELVKIVFPQLRKLCEERDVSWSEIDLRWGITDEEKSEGQVLPICLQEIQNCRPYFIGILGDRYGWVPDAIPSELIDKFGFMRNHPNTSVTELEIWHGVLENPELSANAFFYFRSPGYIQSLPKEHRSNFLELASDEEIQRFGVEKALANVQERQQKLALLKDRIREGRFPLREGFLTPKELGAFVLQDFTDLINRLFPAESKPDILTKERAEHKTYAGSRTRVYIKRKEYFQRLDSHINNYEPPLVILGESGSGKSALMANWAKLYSTQHPNEHLVTHFVGSSSHSSDLNLMLRRLIGELQGHLNLHGDVPDDPTTLPIIFRNLLRALAGKGRVVLLIDALNQLEDRSGVLDLLWLPKEVPANLRIILSTLPGKTGDLLHERNWPVLQIEPLNIEEKRLFIVEYLARYGKKLSTDLIARIAHAQQTALPLFLRSLLEEIRLYGDHFTLDQKISAYLSAPTTEQLFELIVQRYEQDYQGDRPNLVQDMLSLLWGARKGLSEAELLDLLGANESPMPRAFLSPLYLAIEPFLNNHLGIINLFHDHLRKAVQNRYLPNANAQNIIHLQLANYFLKREPSSRSITEGPWQLKEAGAWNQLSQQLVNLPFLQRAWNQNSVDVLTYWHAIQSNPNIKAQDMYKFVLRSPQKYIDSLSLISALLIDLDKLKLALAITKCQVKLYRNTPFQNDYLKSLIRLADLLREGGDLDNSLRTYNESSLKALLLLAPKDDANPQQASYDQIRSAAINQAYRQISLPGADPSPTLEIVDIYLRALHGRSLIEFNNANITAATNLITEGMVFISEALVKYSKISATVKNFFGRHFMIFLTQHTTFAFVTGGENDIFAMLSQSEELCRIYGEVATLATVLNNKGMLLDQQGKYAEALKSLEESRIIFDELGLVNNLRANLRNQSLVFAKQGDQSRAQEFLEKSKKIADRTQRERFSISGDQNKKFIYLRISCQLISYALQFMCVFSIIFGGFQIIFSWLDLGPIKILSAGFLLLMGVSLEANSKWRARMDAASELGADGSAPASVAEIQLRKNKIFDHQVKQMMVGWIFYAEAVVLLIWGILQIAGIISGANIFSSIYGKLAIIAIFNFPLIAVSIIFSYQANKARRKSNP